MTARPSTSRVRAALLSSVLAALIVGLICAKYWGRDTDSSASTDGDASGAVLAQATNSRWNLETNIDGAIYHREGTNLWWAGGMLPTNLLANVKNMPSQEQIRAQIAEEQAARPGKIAGYNAINRQPIVFYGLAVDEKTNALAGAKAKGLAISRTLNGEKEAPFEVTTDERGLFTVTGLEGTTLSVGVLKNPEYHYAPVRLFHYSPMYGSQVHQPDPGNPVVFVLDKVKGAEPLIFFDHGFRAPNTGEPVRIDLTTGEKVQSGGDLIVSIECPMPYREGERFPWRMELQAINGGMIRMEGTRLEFMQEAKEFGYLPGFKVSYGHEGEGFDVQYDGYFYLRSRNGQHYAKLRFDMNTRWDERGVPFGIQSYVNTNASRVLEIDQTKVINLNRINGWR